jgi:hypothetical protein
VKLFRSRPDLGPVKIIIQQGVGRIVGYELADGTIVKGRDCCERP